MNRLSVRLVAAFIVVILVGVVAASAFAIYSTQNQFRQYVARQEVTTQTGMLDQLSAYYRQQRSWSGVASVFENQATRAGTGRGQGQGGPTFTLTDANSNIVYDARTPPAASLSSIERASALPVYVDNAIVGYLVINSPGRIALAQAQQDFEDQMRNSLILGAIIATTTAIAIGLLMSRTLTAPLAHLTRAAQVFAQRNWTHRVTTTHGTQEIDAVAHALNDMAQSLQQAETTRRTMVAEIAHDLRTPLTVIQGNLRAMLDGVYPLTQKEVATLYDETRVLSRLVNDLRELSLADAGQLNLVLRDVSLAPVLQSLAQNFAAAAELQGVELRANSLDTALMVRADAERLHQVLQNLVANAIRHTPQGGTVELTAKRQDSQVVISVTDSGVGIGADDLPRIFERFYRGTDAIGKQGTGLGLAIAKTLTEAMGGVIGVESHLGGGSRFWVALPHIGDNRR
jgi:two-component system OmpR family sensor kinase/two-component system sensor histidine kinase BaeS